MYFLLREMSNTQTKTWLAKKLFSKVLFYYFWKDFRMPNMSNLIFSLHTFSKKKENVVNQKKKMYITVFTSTFDCWLFSAPYCRFFMYRVLLEGGDRIDRWDTKLLIDKNQKTASSFERAIYTIAILLRSRHNLQKWENISCVKSGDFLPKAREYEIKYLRH